jgi:hypothetical protein
MPHGQLALQKAPLKVRVFEPHSAGFARLGHCTDTADQLVCSGGGGLH